MTRVNSTLREQVREAWKHSGGSYAAVRDVLLEHGWPESEVVEDACALLGRNNAPILLADLHAEGALREDAAARWIGDVWSAAEYPDSYLEHDVWRWLFNYAGYTVDGQVSERPTGLLTLYRGSVPERRADWSWTNNLEVAQRYAGGVHYGRPKSKVWVAVVEPWRLLAQNTGRNEDEYVVDTDGLSISEWDGRR